MYVLSVPHNKYGAKPAAQGLRPRKRVVEGVREHNGVGIAAFDIAWQGREFVPLIDARLGTSYESLRACCTRSPTWPLLLLLRGW